MKWVIGARVRAENGLLVCAGFLTTKYVNRPLAKGEERWSTSPRLAYRFGKRSHAVGALNRLLRSLQIPGTGNDWAFVIEETEIDRILIEAELTGGLVPRSE